MKTILLVEDDELLSNLLQTKLIKEGYAVVVAKDGAGALEALEGKAFDLILLDILMPRMNGMEFLEQIRAQKKWEGLPVIILSNSGEPLSKDAEKKFGVVGYLVKANFNPAEVVEKVRQQVGAGSPVVAGEEGANTPQTNEEAAPALRGTISLHSAEGLPAEQAGTTGGKKIRLLVVEDDEFLRELIVTKLVNEGFDVVEAIEGEDGLRKTREGKPDLVLLDIILPGMDGFEFLKQLKADPLIASIPVVMLSNLGQQDDVERALSMGAKDYLIKAHFTPQEIVEKVKSVLGSK